MGGMKRSFSAGDPRQRKKGEEKENFGVELQ